VERSTLAVPGSWSVATLFEALSRSVGIPRRQIAVSWLARGGNGGAPPPVTPHTLGRLSWHDLTALSAPDAPSKVSAPPLSLADGDVLVVRDRHHPVPSAPPPAERATPRRAMFTPDVMSEGGLAIRAPPAGPMYPAGFEGDDARSFERSSGSKSRGVSFG